MHNLFNLHWINSVIIDTSPDGSHCDKTLKHWLPFFAYDQHQSFALNQFHDHSKNVTIWSHCNQSLKHQFPGILTMINNIVQFIWFALKQFSDHFQQITRWFLLWWNIDKHQCTFHILCIPEIHTKHNTG